MRYLILSDIHANWDALEAVLQDSNGLYDQILCCGDLAGYGPDPNTVLDWARTSLTAVIRGNHDRACAGLDDLEWFSPAAKTAALWTRRQLSSENLAFLHDLPRGPVELDGFALVHGSPLDEDEYVTTRDEAANVFPYVPKSLIFFGHTHIQCVFSRQGDAVDARYLPCAQGTEGRLMLSPDAAYLINPGSVGQPRDSDYRAAYLIYDTESSSVSFHRTVYDHEKTRLRIIAAGLPLSLGNRLSAGR